MHQVTVTPEPLRQPSPRCVAPRIRPMSLPWEGFSHRNSRMSVHPLPVVHGVAGIEDAERLLGQQQTSCMRQRPLSRRWNGLGGMACGRWCAGREPRCSGARGSRWKSVELSPGDSSRGHGGGDVLRPPPCRVTSCAWGPSAQPVAGRPGAWAARPARSPAILGSGRRTRCGTAGCRRCAR